MAGFVHVTRDEKRRIASKIHDNLVGRAAKNAADPILDPFIPRSAILRDGLAEHVEEKGTALAERAALAAEVDVKDDNVDRWYRHGYRYIEGETLRRHAPEHAAINALLKAAYPDGLAHIDDRVPDQNEEVRLTLIALRNPEHAATMAAILFPADWVNTLDTAVKESDASFARYQATFSQSSGAVALGRNAEVEWVDWAKAISHAIALRSSGASAEVIEEGKQLIAPLTDAVRQLRIQERARATKRKNDKTP